MAMKFFRKHQKVILACITIGTMFLFIIGDAMMASARSNEGRTKAGLWTRFKRWISGTNEDALASVQGTHYEPEQVKDVALTRFFVFRYFAEIAGAAEMSYWRSLGLTEEDYRDPMKVQEKKSEILKKDPSKSEPIDQIRNSLIAKAFRLSSPVGFTFQREPVPQDALSTVEFLLFKQKADTLGVTVTPAVIKDELISTIGMNQLTEAQIAAMIRQMGRQTSVNMAKPITKLDDFVALLADELRVAIAKSVVEGGQEQLSFLSTSTSAGLTPADLWNTYVKVKTSLTVGIAPIKVEDYISRVPDPSAEDIRTYFDKYKQQYPDPERDTPGFRVPPLYRIGFLYADLTETAKTRKQYNAVVDAMDQITPTAAVNLLAAQGMSPAGTLLSTMVAPNPLHDLVVEYNTQKYTTYRQVEPFVEFAAGKQPGAPWVRVYRPSAKSDHASTAAFVAGAGAALSQGGLLSGDFVLLSQPPRGQLVPPGQNDILNLASALGAAIGSSNLSGTVLAAPTWREGQEDIFVPFATVVGALLDKRYEKKSRAYLMADLTELTTQLGDYAKRYTEWRGKVLRKTAPANQPPFFKEETKQTLQDYLAKFAAARGLEYHETKDLRSRHDLLKEPTEPLLTKYIQKIYVDESRPRPQTQRDLEDTVKYALVRDELRGDQFAQKPRLFEASNTALYKPNNKQIALHWVAEATDPRMPDLNEARPQVVRAWKLEKARALAEQAAQDLINEVKKAAAAAPTADAARKLRDLPGYTPGQTIAEYTEPALRSTSPGPTYERCPIPTMIDYPPADIVRQCLDKLQKDGDLAVLANKPKDVYYLFYLSHRTEPTLSNPLSLEQFHAEVIRASSIRQITVDNSTFKTFAANEKMAVTQKAWDEYIKTLTGFKEEKAKEYLELMKRQN